MDMRKRDRGIYDVNEIFALLQSCDTIRLGLQGGEYPYVVPLSFGAELNGEGQIVLYFHGAGEGEKHDRIRRDPHVCVEADLLRGYRRTEHSVTADYKSVIGFGTIALVEGEEKVHGLELLLAHCKTEGLSAAECALNPRTFVYKIVLTSVTGKQRFTD